MSGEEKSLIDVANEKFQEDSKAMEEMAWAAKRRADEKRREKLKDIEEVVRKVVREELERSPRKAALDLAREKNSDVSDTVEVQLIESSFDDDETKELMDVVRKLAPEMLRTKSLGNITKKMTEVVGVGDVESYVDYVETGGIIPIHNSVEDHTDHVIIQINETGFLQYRCRW